MTNFQEEKARREELKRIRRLTAVSVGLIILGMIIVLTSCASYEEMMTEFDNTCRRVESEECKKLEDKLIAIEDRRAEKRFVKEYIEANTQACANAGGVYLCDGRPQYKLDLIRCGCISRDSVAGLFQ
jgi:DICT domain-containing protein